LGFGQFPSVVVVMGECIPAIVSRLGRP
jgi:hypothetical protein